MQSARYRRLELRVATLDANLLPSVRSTGRYTELEYDRVRGFQLLAHAEIEACLEDVGFDTAVSAYDRWMVDGRPRLPLMAMLAHHQGSLTIPSVLTPSGVSEELRHQIEKAKNAYCHRTRALNNGIREQDVLNLLLPIGLTLAEIDNTWLATIDSFGKTRGGTAHASAIKATTKPDPATERVNVQQIVSGIAPIDSRLLVLRR